MLQRSKGGQLTEFPLVKGRSTFVLFRPSTDWVRPVHSIEDNLLSSKFTDLNVNLTQNYPHRTIPNNI